MPFYGWFFFSISGTRPNMGIDCIACSINPIVNPTFLELGPFLLFQQRFNSY